MIGNGDRLDSWKAIAEYLGRDRTTVMRWARTGGLPVRRVHGGRSVFAYKADLDRWLAGERPPANRPAGPRPLSEGPLTLARSWPVRPRTAAVAGQTLVASDAAGVVVWRHQLPAIDGAVVPARLRVADVDDDGKRDGLAAFHFIRHGGHRSATLMVFDGRGRLRWERSLSDRYRFGADEYAPPWFPEDILVYRAGGATRIAVAQHHHTWWPGVVVTYDADGHTLDRFVNAGWIRQLNVTVDGRYLLAAGISNAFGGAALAVLDASRPGGTSPAGDGMLPACTNCPSGRPAAYFVAPWSALGRPSETPNAVVQVDSGGRIEWHAIQREAYLGKAPEVIIGLSPRFEFVRWGVNDHFRELDSAIGLSAAKGRVPLVREWTPAHGWRDIAVK